MRKWHRWLVIFAGLFLAWIAATGLIVQVITLTGGEHHDARPPAASAPGTSQAAMADAPGARKGGKKGDLKHLITDLHSGAYFGRFGSVVSAVMGAALLFFAVSGMWMYVDMFRKRKRIGRAGLFWK